MNQQSDSIIRPLRNHPLRNRQRGQALVLMGLLLVVLLSAAAFVVDLGDVYYSYQELLATTKSAALAGGGAIPAGTGVTTAYYYGGDVNSNPAATYNIHSNLNITAVTPTLGCISTTTYPNMGLPNCVVYGGQASANSIQVVETAKVPTYFAKIFGVPSVTISATATASAKGGGAPPYHIVMILDSTPSMQQAGAIDSGCIQSNQSLKLTPIQCAEQGIQTLLTYLNPCPTTVATCAGSGTPGVDANAVDQVAMMTFPGLTGSETTTYSNPPVQAPTASDDYSCPPTTGGPPISYYNSNPGYLILPFQSDYRASDTAATLSGTTSNLVKSVGATTDGNCSGIHAVNQPGTFYAGVIDSAQAYLTANTVANVQNIIILLSDGDAASNTTSMGGSAGGPNGVYPSTNQCQQAINRAAVAKAAGTLFYSISYGSETSGCAKDSPAITPCTTMSDIASPPLAQYFFSVPHASGTGTTVCTGAVPITELYQVFTTIAGDLTSSRLIPNSTF